MRRINSLKSALSCAILLVGHAGIVRANELPLGSATYGDADGCQTAAALGPKSDSYTYLDSKGVHGYEQFCGYESVANVQNDKWVVKLHCEGGGGEYRLAATLQKSGNKITFTVVDSGRTKELFACISNKHDRVNRQPSARATIISDTAFLAGLYARQKSFCPILTKESDWRKINPIYSKKYIYFERGQFYYDDIVGIILNAKRSGAGFTLEYDAQIAEETYILKGSLVDGVLNLEWFNRDHAEGFYRCGGDQQDYHPAEREEPLDEDKASVDSGDGDVTEVQSLLYNLGYAISVDGDLGPETATAIRNFQAAANLPQTGRVSQELSNALRAIPPPTIWGAIAYTATGEYMSVWQSTSRRDAETLVLSRLRRRTSEKIAVQSVSGSGCATIVSYRTGRQYGIYSLNGNDIDAAEEGTLAACKRQVRTRCKVVTTICANGRHR